MAYMYTSLLSSIDLTRRRIYVLAFGLVIGFVLLAKLLRRYPTSEPLSFDGASSKWKGSSADKKRYLDPILNSTLGFEKILAINLPERTDRHDGLVLASVVSGLDIDFLDGVHGDKILKKVLPPVHDDAMASSGLGAWRAHINAISRVIENDWRSVLILEDDIDWDVRLKTILQDFAVASNYVLQDSGGSSTVDARALYSSSIPETSPYGDHWDILWLGHCGMEIPDDSARVVYAKDASVPESRHLRSWDENAVTPLTRYPQHSRLIMRQKEGTCSLAYAISQPAARALLLDLGLRRLDNPFDLMLRQWCEGINGFKKHTCIGILPQLFDHHRRVGPSEIDSDIATPHETYREKAYTLNIRYSVRLNMDKILEGAVDYDDQWPDG